MMSTETYLRAGIIKAVKSSSLILETIDTGELIIWPIPQDSSDIFKEGQEIKLGIEPCSSPSISPSTAINDTDHEARRRLLEQLVN